MYNSSIQSLGYGLLSLLLVAAVIVLCDTVKASLKKYLRKMNQKSQKSMEKQKN
jgi:hypothetical protein